MVHFGCGRSVWPPCRPPLPRLRRHRNRRGEPIGHTLQSVEPRAPVRPASLSDAGTTAVRGRVRRRSPAKQFLEAEISIFPNGWRHSASYLGRHEHQQPRSRSQIAGDAGALRTLLERVRSEASLRVTQAVAPDGLSHVVLRFGRVPLRYRQRCYWNARPVARSYALSSRANCFFSRTSRLLRPQGLRPLWYLKSIHGIRGLECRKVSQSIGR